MSDVADTASARPVELGLQVPITATALLLGERIDTRGLEDREPLSRVPLVVRVYEGGLAVVFRYGVVVLFNVAPAAQQAFVTRLAPRVNDPFGERESDEVRVVVQPESDEQTDLSGTISIKEPTLERVQLVADVLAKSLVLSYYETAVASALDRVEPLAERLGSTGRIGSRGGFLLRQIGRVLQVQHKTVGRVEAGEKPDLLWDHPELERLYARLSEEYELRERSRALDRKLEVISRTVETVLDLVQQRSTLRVEWYVVVLIVAELAVGVFALLK
jgi:required for meiotic nuclear division protein 1